MTSNKKANTVLKCDFCNNPFSEKDIMLRHLGSCKFYKRQLIIFDNLDKVVGCSVKVKRLETELEIQQTIDHYKRKAKDDERKLKKNKATAKSKVFKMCINATGDNCTQSDRSIMAHKESLTTRVAVYSSLGIEKSDKPVSTKIKSKIDRMRAFKAGKRMSVIRPTNDVATPSVTAPKNHPVMQQQQKQTVVGSETGQPIVSQVCPPAISTPSSNNGYSHPVQQHSRSSIVQATSQSQVQQSLLQNQLTHYKTSSSLPQQRHIIPVQQYTISNRQQVPQLIRTPPSYYNSTPETTSNNTSSHPIFQLQPPEIHQQLKILTPEELNKRRPAAPTSVCNILNK